MAAPLAQAQDIDVVRHATAEWQGFTDADGSGLYNEILAEAFAASGATVEREYVPLNRAVVLVERGEADVTGGFTKDDRNFATQPIFETTIGLMGRPEVLEKFESLADLEGLRLVGAPRMSGELENINMSEVESRAQAARLVTSGRADVYVDLLMVLEDFVATGTSTLDVNDAITADEQFDINPDDWTLATAKTSRLFLLFSDSPRGDQVRDMFDAGMVALAESGRLEEIYSSYGFETPTVE